MTLNQGHKGHGSPREPREWKTLWVVGRLGRDGRLVGPASSGERSGTQISSKSEARGGLCSGRKANNPSVGGPGGTESVVSLLGLVGRVSSRGGGCMWSSWGQRPKVVCGRWHHCAGSGIWRMGAKQGWGV